MDMSSSRLLCECDNGCRATIHQSIGRRIILCNDTRREEPNLPAPVADSGVLDASNDTADVGDGKVGSRTLVSSLQGIAELLCHAVYGGIDSGGCGDGGLYTHVNHIVSERDTQGQEEHNGSTIIVVIIPCVCVLLFKVGIRIRCFVFCVFKQRSNQFVCLLVLRFRNIGRESHHAAMIAVDDDHFRTGGDSYKSTSIIRNRKGCPMAVASWEQHCQNQHRCRKGRH